jgi:hypothetical protein
MNVRYQIIVEVEANGMKGPLHVLTMVENTLQLGKEMRNDGITLGKVRIAAVYPLAPPEQKPVVERVPGSDQSRQVEEVRDRRIT